MLAAKFLKLRQEPQVFKFDPRVIQLLSNIQVILLPHNLSE